jgi:hypothetical protein
MSSDISITKVSLPFPPSLFSNKSSLVQNQMEGKEQTM